MKALFGVVSLLVALAIVGLVAVKQLKAAGHVASPATTESGAAAVSQMSGSGSVRDQTRPLPRKVVDDVAKAMSEAASARGQDPEK